MTNKNSEKFYTQNYFVCRIDENKLYVRRNITPRFGCIFDEKKELDNIELTELKESIDYMQLATYMREVADEVGKYIEKEKH